MSTVLPDEDGKSIKVDTVPVEVPKPGRLVVPRHVDYQLEIEFKRLAAQPRHSWWRRWLWKWGR